MHKTIKLTVSLYLLLCLFGCGGTSSGEKISRNYRDNLGVATGADLKDQSYRVVNANGYEIERMEDSESRVYIETKWKDRTLFEDEVEKGFLQARSRLIIEARPKSRGALILSKTLFRIYFVGETLAQTANYAGWIKAEITPKCRSYFKEIADKIKSELATRSREF